jgi:amino acid transporter
VFEKESIFKKIKNLIIGKEKNPLDKNVFHSLSLIAFFAWVGLGADGLSSSCYGPEESFLALGQHSYLALIIGILTVITIFVISASYSQIIELFPNGGGGYLVASKLLSPNLGMVSGSALLIDYVLTIAISIASGADAVFSFLPASFLPYKLYTALFFILLLTVINLRGVKESVVYLVPIFLCFVATHAVVIIYAFAKNITYLPGILSNAHAETINTYSSIGLFGTIFLIMKSYSMGSGTYTGIEAVSNGLSVLREPRIATGKRTMKYMAISLSIVVLGLMTAYLIYNVGHIQGKTLNAVLFENMTSGLGSYGKIFVFITLLSEGMILFVASQTGFLGGPRVLANMAVDKWFPSKFASLSDRLVSQNGILLMGIAAFIIVFFTKGSVKLLVIFYSINVFITFSLSQLGMVKHWIENRGAKWKKRLIINGIGFILCTCILISVVVIKFYEGGWVTVFVTGLVVFFAIMIKRHYRKTLKTLRRLNSLLDVVKLDMNKKIENKKEFDPSSKTAVIFVNGYNGLGLHSLFNVVRLFSKEFKNYVFVQIGIIDAGNFKGYEEMENLRIEIQKDVDKYVNYMQKSGFYSSGMTFIDTDAISAIDKAGPAIIAKYPNSIFFGGQLVFAKNNFVNRWLHNYTVFAMQERFYQEGIPFIILPIRVDVKPPKPPKS